MNRKNEILQELAEISTVVAGIGAANPYSAPEGYWDTLAGGVLTQLQLQQAKQSPTYTVPEGYFAGLPGSILAGLPLQRPAGEQVFDELEQQAPFLNTLARQMPYSLPEGYFERFSTTLPLQQPARVVPLYKKTRQWLAYLSAAAVAGVMVTGAFMLEDNSQSYNHIKNINITEGVARLSEDEIVNYLDAYPSNPDIVTTTREEEPDWQNSVNNMSEDEIQQYLQENNEPGEPLLKGI